MQENYYNYMMESFLKELKKMVTINEPKTMLQYKTLNLRIWDRIHTFVDALNEYSGKRTPVMDYYSKELYPILKAGEVRKFGLKKVFAIRIDDYEFRQIIAKCQSLIH